MPRESKFFVCLFVSLTLYRIEMPNGTGHCFRCYSITFHNLAVDDESITLLINYVVINEFSQHFFDGRTSSEIVEMDDVPIGTASYFAAYCMVLPNGTRSRRHLSNLLHN